MNVLVIAGGEHNERSVSLRSGQAVREALTKAGHTVSSLDPAEHIITKSLSSQYDVAFPVVHGLGGEDGTLQATLERIGIPYVGSGISASHLCFDKSEYRRILTKQQLPVAKGALVHGGDIQTHPITKKPFVLKPYAGGSSIDTFIVRDQTHAPWEAILRTLNDTYGEMLAEELIEGTEVTVGVLDTQALPVVEIVPPTGGEFDYNNKYNGETEELCPPKSISKETQQRAQELARRIHDLTDCRHYSRTDMIIKPGGEIIVLETNTLPGMTDQSLFPKAAKAAGISMNQLCDQLVKLAAS